MGRALIGGLLRGGWRAEQLSVAESQPAAREALARDFGISAAGATAAAVAGAPIVVLAVKPQDAAAVLQPLGAALAAGRSLLISVAAGVRCAALESWCGAGVPVMRAMPNRPARVGAAATGLFAAPAVSHGQRVAAERVLQAVGEVFWVPTEELLDVVTALSGSGRRTSSCSLSSWPRRAPSSASRGPWRNGSRPQRSTARGCSRAVATSISRDCARK